MGITAVWGVTFVVVADALHLADPFTFLALRFALGALVVTAFARRAMLHGATLRAGLLLGVALFFGYALQTEGLRFTTPSRSAFITGLSVVLVPLVSFWVVRRRPTPPALLGVVLSVVGLFVLTGGLSGFGSETALGDLLTLGCAVAFAFQVALTERWVHEVRLSGLVAVQLWTVCGLSLLCLPFGGAHLEPTWSLWGAVAICGLLASALAYFVQTWAQVRTTAVRAALIFALEPLFAAACSAVTGREALTGRELLGGAGIISGVLVAEVGGVVWKRRRSPSRRTVS